MLPLEVLILLHMCLSDADKEIFLSVSHCQRGLKGTDVVVDIEISRAAGRGPNLGFAVCLLCNLRQMTLLGLGYPICNLGIIIVPASRVVLRI